LSSGSSKKTRATLLLEHEQRPLDQADRRIGDVAVFRGEIGRPRRQVLKRRLQVLEINQRQLPSSAILKAMLSTPSLRFISRESSSVPISEIVARIEVPCSPNGSQKITG
jgi:hypothetical protein